MEINTGFASEKTFAYTVSMSEKKETQVRITFTAPAGLREEIARIAEEKGVSTSAVIRWALRNYLETD